MLPVYHNDTVSKGKGFVTTHVVLGVFISLIALQVSFVGSMFWNAKLPEPTLNHLPVYSKGRMQHISSTNLQNSDLVVPVTKYLFPVIGSKVQDKENCFKLLQEHASSLNRTFILSQFALSMMKPSQEDLSSRKVVEHSEVRELPREQQDSKSRKKNVPTISAFVLTLTDNCRQSSAVPFSVRSKSFKGTVPFRVGEDICMHPEVLEFEDGISAVKDRLKHEHFLVLMMTQSACDSTSKL
jgi:hypothetical protein